MTFARAQLLAPPIWDDFPLDHVWYYAAGSGPLMDVGVYALTALTGLFGPALRVSAMAGTIMSEHVIRTARQPGGAFATKWLTPCTSTSTFGGLFCRLRCLVVRAGQPQRNTGSVRRARHLVRRPHLCQYAHPYLSPRQWLERGRTHATLAPQRRLVSRRGPPLDCVCTIPNPSPVPPMPGTCWTSCSRRCVRRRRDRALTLQTTFQLPQRHPDEECIRR